MSNTIKAWHFVGKTLRDGSPIPKIGEKLVHTGELLICKSGYHASEKIEPGSVQASAPGRGEVAQGAA